jgi:hypothetical protein
LKFTSCAFSYLLFGVGLEARLQSALSACEKTRCEVCVVEFHAQFFVDLPATHPNHWAKLRWMECSAHFALLLLSSQRTFRVQTVDTLAKVSLRHW